MHELKKTIDDHLSEKTVASLKAANRAAKSAIALDQAANDTVTKITGEIAKCM